MAILSKFQDQETLIIDDLTLAEAKTKQMAGIFKALKLQGTTCLLGTAGQDAKVYKAARNIPGVEIMPAAQFNAYSVLRPKRLLLTAQPWKSYGRARTNKVSDASQKRFANDASQKRFAIDASQKRFANGADTMATVAKKEPTRGPKLEPEQIILRPLITEKGTHQFTHHNAYPFEVNLWANKDQIRAAVEELFGVRVLKGSHAAAIGQASPVSL